MTKPGREEIIESAKDTAMLPGSFEEQLEAFAIHWYEKGRQAGIEQFRAEKAELEGKVISGFHFDEIPQFRQGIPKNELESEVTADDVSWYVKKIHELYAELAALKEQKP